ncbi:helix-turn-helix domain-containing protein [Amycolatopsis jejuensis]|uniref:helix-turn-helix domain-containing protein n=1 Tax=Amycolatopsis jejuensis TaxID=330084 RepID=UPI0005276014|nr:hypothetical protein [Amycolatopsis jejuensis]
MDTPGTPHPDRTERADRNRRMLESWQAGASITEIAREHGLSLGWTGRLLRKQGADQPEVRPGVRRELDVKRIAAEYRSGATLRSLADRHQASYGTIRRLLLRENVAIRPHGGHNAGERRSPNGSQDH